MKNLLFSGPEFCRALVTSCLGQHFRIEYPDDSLQTLSPYFERCSVFLDASMKVPVTRTMLDSAPHLQLVVAATTGTNHIDSAALEERRIPLFSLKQREVLSRITAAAEHSWLLLMACARKLRPAIESVEKGEWNRQNFPGTMLRGKRLGIIGFGRLGRWMARYAEAFGLDISAHDPLLDSFPPNVRRASLEQILTSSDFISIHVHLTESTRGMLSAQKISTIKRGCVLINTSRGEIIDEVALVQSLKEGQIAAVGADVLWSEPAIRESPLWQYSAENSNVILTPHIGGLCPEAVELVVLDCCQRIVEHFSLG